MVFVLSSERAATMRIKQLADLRDQGIISVDEYTALEAQATQAVRDLEAKAKKAGTGNN